MTRKRIKAINVARRSCWQRFKEESDSARTFHLGALPLASFFFGAILVIVIKEDETAVPFISKTEQARKEDNHSTRPNRSFVSLKSNVIKGVAEEY